jgi:hypothetical protein
LFDHLICATEQGEQNGQPERLGGPEVDDELELGRLSMMFFAYLPFREQ